MFKGKSRLGKRTHDSKLDALVDQIRFLHNSKNDLGVKNLVKNQPLNLLIEALEILDDEHIVVRFLVGAYKIKMGDIFMALSPNMKDKVLHVMKSGICNHLLEDMNADDVYELYLNSSTPIQKKIILNASKQLKGEIKRLKEFGFAEVGSIMNTTFITLLSGMTISEAVNFLKRSQHEFDIGEEIFVLDSHDKVIGKVDIKRLFLTHMDLNRSEEDTDGIIEEIMEKSFITVYEDEDIDEIIDLFKKYNIRSIAILNKNQQLAGIIDYQDIIPEILDSNIEDVSRFYGIKETQKSYLNSSIMEIVKSRITCLIIMLFAATITTWAIDKFEGLGVQYTAGISTAILVPIIPIITDMCGNTGSQTTATIIQAYSSGELRKKDFRTAINKELKISVTIGGILALVNMARLMLYFAVFNDPEAFKSKVHLQDAGIAQLLGDNLLNSKGSDAATNLSNSSVLYKISLVGALSSSLSLWIVVIFSKFFGVLIPLVAIRFNYDPAAVSAPILTTILDTVASIIFFGIGILMLQAAIAPIIGVNVSGGKLVSNAATATSYAVQSMSDWFETMRV